MEYVANGASAGRRKYSIGKGKSLKSPKSGVIYIFDTTMRKSNGITLKNKILDIYIMIHLAPFLRCLAEFISSLLRPTVSLRSCIIPFDFFLPKKLFFAGISSFAIGARSRTKAGPALALLLLAVLPMSVLLPAVCGRLLDLVPGRLMKLEMLSIVSKRLFTGRKRAGEEWLKELRCDRERVGD